MKFEDLAGKTLADMPRSKAAAAAAKTATDHVEQLTAEVAAIDASASDGESLSPRLKRDAQARRLKLKAELLTAYDARDDARAVLLSARSADFQMAKPIIAAEHARRLQPVLDALDALDAACNALHEVEATAGSYFLPMGSVSSRKTIELEVAPPVKAFCELWRNTLRSLLGAKVA